MQENPIIEQIKRDINYEQELSTKQYFAKMLFKGVIVILPMAIIYIVLALLFDLVFELIEPLSILFSPGGEPTFLINILTLVVLGLMIFSLGLVVDHEKGQNWMKKFETDYLCKIPLYSTIRDTIQQFSGMKDMPFKQVVLVDPFGTGVMMTGFVTEKVNDEIYTVFVPTAPNPTNGNIYHFPVSRITFLQISSDTAMRSVVGMGTGSSVLFNKETPELTHETRKEKVVHDLKKNDVLVMP